MSRRRASALHLLPIGGFSLLMAALSMLLPAAGHAQQPTVELIPAGGYNPQSNCAGSALACGQQFIDPVTDAKAKLNQKFHAIPRDQAHICDVIVYDPATPSHYVIVVEVDPTTHMPSKVIGQSKQGGNVTLSAPGTTFGEPTDSWEVYTPNTPADTSAAQQAGNGLGPVTSGSPKAAKDAWIHVWHLCQDEINQIYNPPPPPQPPQPPPPGAGFPTPTHRTPACEACRPAATALNTASDALAQLLANSAPYGTLVAARRAQVQALAQALDACEKQCRPAAAPEGRTGMAPTAPGAAPGGGFYVGGQIGERWTGTNWTAASQTTLGGPDLPANPSADLNSDPVRGKVLAGYDWMVAPNWLAGVVADAGFGSNSATQARIPGTWGTGGIASATAAASDRISVSQSWDASLRARAGTFVMPTVLAYGTAGVDFLHGSFSLNCTLAGACGAVGAPVAASGSTTRAGWVAGGGVQFGLEGLGLGPSWNGQVEYLHADFGSFGATLGAPATLATAVKLKETTDTVMLGLIYRFGAFTSAAADRLPAVAAAPLAQSPRTRQVASLEGLRSATSVAVREEPAPAAAPPREAGPARRFTIRFDERLAALTPSSIRALDEAMDAIHAEQTVEIAIEGCGAEADSSDGSVCARRAMSVRQLLAQRGVKSPRSLLVAELR